MALTIQSDQGATASAHTTPKVAVRLRGLTKTFGDHQAVAPTDVDIYENEFFSILGPSGCGKTTLMRMITGFEAPTAGSIELDGRNVDGVSTRDRDLNMLFQSYALFPHLTVYENVAFELRVRKTAKDEIDGRVRDALELVRLGDFAQRKPSQLSGGQRQRVALARAVIGRPAVVLLDEPLGALDQKLRKEMQFELKRMQREVGITFIYVTHDQEEALTMSDRIAVMSEGRILQLASPTEIYDKPNSRFVATFIGECNIVEGVALESGVEIPEVGPVPTTTSIPTSAGSAAAVAIRPERVQISVLPPDDRLALRATVKERVFLGDEWMYRVTLDGGQLLSVRVASNEVMADVIALPNGASAWITWSAADAQVLADDSTTAVSPLSEEVAA